MMVALIAALLDGRPASALGQECMASYYRTRSSACVDGILADFRSAPRADPNTLTGFLAELFRSSPDERDRILKAETADYLKSIDLASLWLAGLTQEAETFAKAANRTDQMALAQRTFPVGLDAIKPSSLPRDNDLLIGAYMASGKRDFIAHILANYATADDNMVTDALRMGYMMSKFGPNLKPPSREPVMIRNACDKYRCKTDQRAFLRVLTLATAFWSLQSLSGQDEGIKAELTAVFLGDARLKPLFLTEQAAFGNYIAAMVGAAAMKNPQGDDQQRAAAAFAQAADVYENFGSAKDSLAPLQALPARPAKN
jgi:hypothetical protein